LRKCKQMATPKQLKRLLQSLMLLEGKWEGNAAQQLLLCSILCALFAGWRIVWD
jgi:hypothetical protein